MNYLIIGAGGIGGCLGAYMAAAGLDVAFVARGGQQKALKEKGITVRLPAGELIESGPVEAFDSDEVKKKYDVILVCVKGYSLDSIVPAIRAAAHEKSVVIPILNALNAGARLRAALTGLCVLGGCVYLSAYVSAPGEIIQCSSMVRIVFGEEEGLPPPPGLLEALGKELESAGIDGIHSKSVRRDIFKKFAFTSAFVGVAARYDLNAGSLRENQNYRSLYIEFLAELEKIGRAMGIDPGSDFIGENLRILHTLLPETTASMQKDIKAGKLSEMDELLFDVDRLAVSLKVEAPQYRRAAQYFRSL